jgi:antirestriction protein
MIALATPTTTTQPMGEWFTELSEDTQADITNLVNNEGYPLHDIEEFIETYGAQAYIDGHYMTWCELTDNHHDDDAIRAWVENEGIDNIDDFVDAYVGEYDSEKVFAEEVFTHNYHIESAIADGLVVDWEATWDSMLSYSYNFYDGFVFNSTT